MPVNKTPVYAAYSRYCKHYMAIIEFSHILVTISVAKGYRAIYVAPKWGPDSGMLYLGCSFHDARFVIATRKHDIMLMSRNMHYDQYTIHVDARNLYNYRHYAGLPVDVSDEECFSLDIKRPCRMFGKPTCYGGGRWRTFDGWSIKYWNNFVNKEFFLIRDIRIYFHGFSCNKYTDVRFI
jgi:hypothetical protein